MEVIGGGEELNTLYIKQQFYIKVHIFVFHFCVLIIADIF